MKKLPIGLQDFKKLREGGFLYIDKTEVIYQMTQQAGYYFLSRPRRFGKSLLISTLAELFKGNQVLFEDLWIADQWDWSQTHPVLTMSFNQGTHRVVGLEAFLCEELKRQAKSYGIELADASYPSQFRELIELLSKRHGRVVVLIDEYDKPILDYLHDIPQAEANREILKNFYAVLKPLDAHLRF
ncbi:MAG: AAA family ATPase, partial [Microscillaceae bacterium]|nr:AAA family ATPase [Microscillaceae bacterium]